MGEKMFERNLNENPFHLEKEAFMANQYMNAKNTLQNMLKRDHRFNEKDKEKLRDILDQEIFEFEGEMLDSEIISNLSKAPETIRLAEEESETMDLLESIKQLIYNDYKEIIHIIEGLNEKIKDLNENERFQKKFLIKKEEKEEDLKEIINKIHKLIDKIGFEKKEIKAILDQMQEAVKENRGEDKDTQES